MRPRSLSALASHAVKAAPAGGLAPGLDLFDRSGVWEPRRWLRGESSPPVLAGECQMSYLFFSLSKEFEGEKIEMPAGLYASMFHNDIVTGHISKFSQLLEELRQTGWRACGHACIFDQMSGFLQESGYSYLAKYMVRVERGDVYPR